MGAGCTTGCMSANPLQLIGLKSMAISSLLTRSSYPIFVMHNNKASCRLILATTFHLQGELHTTNMDSSAFWLYFASNRPQRRLSLVRWHFVFEGSCQRCTAALRGVLERLQMNAALRGVLERLQMNAALRGVLERLQMNRKVKTAAVERGNHFDSYVFGYIRRVALVRDGCTSLLLLP
jgi:hypothetical protein